MCLIYDGNGFFRCLDGTFTAVMNVVLYTYAARTYTY